MLVSRCRAPFQEYKSTGPRWDKYSGRLTMSLVPIAGGKKLSMSYARYMMTCHMGRVLDTAEEVDHIDGDRTNDSLENLQILTKSQNSRKTVTDPLAIARRRKIMWFLCPHCTTRFERQKSKSHLATGGSLTFCSRVCGSFSKLYLDHKQEYGKVYIEFTPKNLGEPWANWSDPIPVEVRSNGLVTKKKKYTICRTCRTPFPAARGKKFCCDACARAARSENVPSKAKMVSLIASIRYGTASWASIGRDYEVSDNAVRKWAKKYQLL
jgi:predicted RNA-binding Zn-ribbon protein involved in translation (DUF1610 family)